MALKSILTSSSSGYSRKKRTGNLRTPSGQHDHLLLSAIVNASEDAILSKTLEGIITSWNPAAERMFGYTAQEIIGKPKAILFPPDRLQEEEAILARLRQGIPTDRFETVRLHKDGTLLNVSVTISPIKDEDGRVIGASTIARDITEREQAEEQVQLLSTVVAESMNGVVITDPQERILYVNPAFERIAGYTLEELRGSRPAETLQGPDTSAHTRGQVRAAIAAQEPVTVEILNYHKNGTPYWIEMHIAQVRTTTGTVSHFVAIENDVTSRKQAEHQRQEDAERLRVSEERYSLAVEGSQNGLWDLDVCTGEMHVSARWEQMIGYAEGEFPHHVEAWIAHLHPDDRPRMEAMVSAYYDRKTDVYEAEFRLRHKDGSYRWILSRGVGRFDSEGQPQRMAGSHMDITERKRLTEQLEVANGWQTDAIEQLILKQAELRQANDRLEALATTDSLTGIKNHRGLQERLREEYDRAMRYNTPFSLLMLDVDNFKKYNDTYGHPAGDVVLRQVAQVLQETARTCDIVARYGGEEFVVLLPEADVDEAKTVAERFRHAVETAAWPERGITVSIGAATLTPTTLHPDALLADADTALYRSKHQGRNCVTHTNDTAEVEGLDTEAAGWADALFQKLLAIQRDQEGEVSEQVRESLLHAYDATIISWSRILDLKDKETEGHSERVTEWMVRLTQYLGFNAQEMRLARWGACLHDIGKIAVPDHILHKQGPLTDEEWVIMRQHTSIAFEMLKSIEFLGEALDIPYCHHEKWDGSGYPRGLKGDEIPLMARLFAVVDVYDALTSDRPYRKAWSAERVKVYLQEQSGTHFDPWSVDAFLNMLSEECAMPQAA